MARFDSVVVVSLLAAGAVAGCGAASSGKPKDSFGIVDAGGQGAAGAGGADTGTGATFSCTTIRVVMSAATGCRADWTCVGQGLYTFVCGPADAGKSSCYCLTPNGAPVSGPLDGCSGGS